MSVYGPLPSPTAVSHSSPAGVAGPASFLHPNHAFFNNNSNNNNKMQQHLHPLNDYSADFRMLPSNLHLPSPSANLFERSMNALVSNFKGTIAKSSYDNIQPNTTTLSGPHDDWAWENALAGYSNNNNDIDERDLEGQDLLGMYSWSSGAAELPSGARVGRAKRGLRVERKRSGAGVGRAKRGLRVDRSGAEPGLAERSEVGKWTAAERN
ncbi:hypothetical protein DFJ77DRAFT_473737 [Powellomyces hirtus]|nr:hypothetical protein DFJ77DRAFT_473737 [Powellomyces hirtus]